MSRKRRPKPTRSGYETWAPIATPLAAARTHVARSVDGSPAWKPHATLALVTSAEQGLVVADLPDAVRLPDVAVEVDGHGGAQVPPVLASVVSASPRQQGRDLVVGEPLEAAPRRPAHEQRHLEVGGGHRAVGSGEGADGGPHHGPEVECVGRGRSGGLGEAGVDRGDVAAEHARVALVDDRAVVVDVEHLVAVGR